MSIFNQIFKKRKQLNSSDELKIVIKTDRGLSEKQKHAIFTIVRNGTMSGAEPSDIVIQIMMSTGIYGTVILTRFKNSVEVII